MAEINIVVSGYYGFNNAGDEAMLYAILRSLNQLFDHPGITVISGHPENTEKTFHVKTVPRFNMAAIMKALWHCDLLISGGGSLLQDVTSWKSLMYYLTIIMTGIVMRKHVFLFSQGIGPVRHRWIRWLLKIVLNHVDAITVRDSESKGFLERLGVKNRIYCTADAVLTLSPVPLDEGKKILKENHVPSDKKLIGISVRHWMNSNDWMEKFRQYIEEMKKNGDYAFVFIPMQYPEDVKAAQSIVPQKEDGVYILKGPYDTEQLVSLIGNLDLLIGIRLHALIFASLMHVPFIGISYDPKIDNFLNSVGQVPIFSINQFDGKKLSRQSRMILSNKSKFGDWAIVDRLRNQACETLHILDSVIHRKEAE